MKKIIILLASAFAVVGLSGCATPHVVEETRISDNDLSCASLQSEIDEAKRFEQQARSEKGITGTNVVAGLLFWPAIVGTYANANEAIDAAQERQDHLLVIFNKKRLLILCERWGGILRSTVLLAVLSGCATPHVVDEIKISDRDLSCDALVAEISKANAYERSAEEDRASGEGTKTAFISGIMFPPIWAAVPVLMMVDGTTNSKVNDAVEAARRRRNHLYDLYNEKKCSDN